MLFARLPGELPNTHPTAGLTGAYLNKHLFAAIGAFYAVTHKLIRASELKFNLLFQLYCAINICCILSLRCVIKNDEFNLYRLILLIICMDIHLNPGPASDTINSPDILHLNIRSNRNKT